MKLPLILMFFFVNCVAHIEAQEFGTVVLNIPDRSSLKFNKFLIHPTFSFVREQNKYLSITNQRQWVQFDDAPSSYIASYSGRFNEKFGLGMSVFQQNYGVLTSFGAIVNMAYNARLQYEQNLTFGLNLEFIKSGVNDGNIITNIPDPVINNIPSNAIAFISPGINYGLEFIDVGLVINNLIQYNLTSSELINEDTQRSIQAHVMYTGYMDVRGFFDDTKFSTLIRSEFKTNKTEVSGLAILQVPKGIWGQIGYHSRYGVSAGIGLNITEQIAIEYNFEKAIGKLDFFGNSHNITIAYRFKNGTNDRRNDEESAFVIPRRKRRVLATSSTKRAKTKKSVLTEISGVKPLEEGEKILKNQANVKIESKIEVLEHASQPNIKIEITTEKSPPNTKIAEEKLDEIELTAKAEKQRILAQKAILFEITHKDDLAAAMFEMVEKAKTAKQQEENLLIELDVLVDAKNNDLKALKEENDLSEQGVYQKPTSFKSISKQKKILENLKTNIDTSIKMRENGMSDLELTYQRRLKKMTDEADKTNKYYLSAIKKLKEDHKQLFASKQALMLRLKAINTGLEFERKRRIKKAIYDNESDRYKKDTATLNSLKKLTKIGSNTNLKIEDFDFGNKFSANNIQIIKGVTYAKKGYYLILAVHSDIKRRDEFITKVVLFGEPNIDFFYDVKTSMYYIFSQKFNSLNAAKIFMQLNKQLPFMSEVSIIKVEN
ncbi:PorP/SprF family type IX secretion system membrane protein [Flavobacteriaceae bacterium]|nr:PorP/SprF family type IX secretion system membrane protein [Flavobacteriaceae bacterium]